MSWASWLVVPILAELSKLCEISFKVRGTTLLISGSTPFLYLLIMGYSSILDYI